MPLSIDPLAIQPVAPAIAAIAADDLGVALQPGTVVDARVLKRLDADLVRIAIANLTLDVQTTKPLQQGQTLQLAVVKTADGVTLMPMSARGLAVIVDDIPLAPGAPSRPPAPILTPQETQAVAAAAQIAVTKQAGLGPLFSDLVAAMPSGKLPQPVLLAAAQVLGLRIPDTAPLKGNDIKAALQSSGLTMEAALARPARIAAPAAASPAPDMKAALLVLRQALSSWLTQDVGSPAAPRGASPSVAPQAATVEPSTASPPRVTEPQTPVPVARSANAMLAGGLLPEAQPIVRGELPAVGVIKELLTAQLLQSVMRAPGEAAPPQDVPPRAQAAIPPPVRGAPPHAQAVAAPSLLPDAEPATIARHLIAETDGALARQTLLQIASLPDRVDVQTLRTDPAQPRWHFEIPFVTPQGTAMAQFEIARDGGGVEAEASQRVWRARFSLNIEPAGPVHALISFAGDTTSVKMWAERPATAAQLRANAFQLTRSLDRAELKAGDIVVADGAPAPAKVASGHFLNRAT